MSFLHKNAVNLYIGYKLGTRSRDLNTDFTLHNSLFGAVKLTKNSKQINMDIVIMVLDSMQAFKFHGPTVPGLKMLLCNVILLIL